MNGIIKGEFKMNLFHKIFKKETIIYIFFNEKYVKSVAKKGKKLIKTRIYYLDAKKGTRVKDLNQNNEVIDDKILEPINDKRRIIDLVISEFKKEIPDFSGKFKLKDLDENRYITRKDLN